MKVIFLTMTPMEDLESKGIYTDLLRRFVAEGHAVHVVYPRERRLGKITEAYQIGGTDFLGVRTLNLQKTSSVEKGIGQVLVERQFRSAIKRYWADEKFDLILYSTPPITLTGVVEFLKRKNPHAKTYLLLKDIFPQNAVDIGMLSKTGIRGLLYRFFRHKEKVLYQVSDHIGCMSPANARYILEHNPEISPAKVEIAPNSREEIEESDLESDTLAIRSRYGLPLDRPIFIYGGNMGRPQGIPFFLECLKALEDRDDCHFVVIGDGTEYPKLQAWVSDAAPKNVSLYKRVPKDEYDLLAKSSDVGLIFLDHRFTIPNYPSRLLPYLMMHKPVIAATDPNSDIGTIAQENGYGYWCESDSVEGFVEAVDRMLSSDIREMGEAGYRFYMNNYTIEHTYDAIVKHCND